MNPKQRAAFFNAMNQVMQPDKIGEIVVGAAADMHSGALPDAEMASNSLTVGDFRSVGAFWKSQDLVNEMASMAIGRTVALSCRMLNIQTQDPEIFEFLISTDEFQEALVKMLMDFFKQSFPQIEYNEARAKELVDHISAFNLRMVGRLN